MEGLPYDAGDLADGHDGDAGVPSCPTDFSSKILIYFRKLIFFRL